MENKEVQSFIFETLKKEYNLKKSEVLNFLKSQSYTMGKGRNEITLYNEVKTTKGFRVVYVSNPNFMQGAWNGGGCGVFAKLQYCGCVKTIRLIKD